MPLLADDDVFSLAEFASAAGVAPGVVIDLAARGSLPTVGPAADPLDALVTRDVAVAAVQALASGGTVGGGARAVVAVATELPRPSGVPVLVSTGLHGLVALAIAVIASFGWSLRADAPPDEAVSHEPVRLVYLALPGPGGGGGGGGLRQKAPAPKVQREGDHSLNSPLPARELPPPAPIERPPDPIEAKTIVAPIASAPADTQTTPGVLRDIPPAPVPTQGPGDGGGAGTGQGAGLGEGSGSGIGDGLGGGMGGGPYRPGSGVEPPRLLREVKADYTDEARRRSISGDVVLEIVVRSDGSVGEVKMLQGLGAGLDQRAIQAVRQWRFDPARRKGVPVDVLVEVAVEFMLR